MTASHLDMNRAAPATASRGAGSHSRAARPAAVHRDYLSLRHLKAVLRVAEAQNVTGAARLLGRSQTAVTKSLNEIETRLGRRLFDRSPKGMRLTAYGAVLARRIAVAADLFDRAARAYVSQNAAPHNVQTIALFTMDVSARRLRTLIELTERGDIAATARARGLSQAAIYKLVNEFEGQLAIPLFTRRPGGVTATDFCRLLTRHAKLALAEIRHGLDEIAALDGKTQGRVDIGTMPSARSLIVPRAFDRLMSRHPELTVTTRESPYDNLAADLRNGDIDMIVGNPIASYGVSDLSHETLFTDRIYLAARHDHPLTAKEKVTREDLSACNWVLMTQTTPAWKTVTDTFERHNLSLPGNCIETISMTTLRGLLLETDRISLVSEQQIHHDLRAGTIRPIPFVLDDDRWPIGVTVRAQTTPSPAAELFLTILREVTAELAAASTGG